MGSGAELLVYLSATNLKPLDNELAVWGRLIPGLNRVLMGAQRNRGDLEDRIVEALSYRGGFGLPALPHLTRNNGPRVL